ncbi:MAG: energy-coupling factor transporter transmembrane component T [Acholeplasmataceae bacterium]
MKTFERHHPILIIFYFTTVIGITMLTLNPILIILSLFGSVSFLIVLLGIKSTLKSLAFSIPLLIFIASTNPFFTGRGTTVLFYFYGRPFALEAVYYGLAAAAMLISIFYWFRNYHVVMTSDKFTYLFGRIIPKLSLMISMVFAFVPKFRKQYRAIDDSQKAIGIYTSKRYGDRLKSRIRIFSILLTWGLESSIETAQSMQARGYGLKGRTNYSLFHWSKSDSLATIVIGVIFIPLWIFYFKGDFAYSYYPQVQTINLGIKAVITYCLWLLGVTYPTIIEMKEKIRWRYLQSKI